MEAKVVEREIGGSLLRLETGKLAKQADGAVLVSYAGSAVLTAVVSGPPRGTGDFFPLTVDYRERAYAAGKFPGGFKKREGPPSTKEILTMRLTDRPIRPLFPKGYVDEVQIMTTVLSSDRENDTDVLSMIGASAALSVSKLPFLGPIAALRISRSEDGELILLPTYEQIENSDLDLIVAGNDDSICMIEGFAKELPEDQMSDAILGSVEPIRQIIAMQRELREKAGLGPVELPEPDDDSLFDQASEKYFEQIKTAKQTEGKQARAEAVDEIAEKIREEYTAKEPEEEPTADQVEQVIYKLQKKAVRQLILDGTRPDGRGADDIRDLYSEVNLLPRPHGSALFQRGETQSLTISTLGSPADEQRVDGLSEEYSKRFMLDYNFPPFSVGECRPIRGPGRREIGHGMLAERSLQAVIPSHDRFPYTIRLVSEILESNGSSSMASVCAGTLCLMDTGVPIKDPVAGISIGMVKEGDNYTLLTDIMGDEDHYGDMDFKVAGTQNGITGIQLDLKITGVTEQIIRDSLQRARKARIAILRHMLSTLKRPNKQISQYAPTLITMKINPEKIGAVIGPGGKNIRGLQESTKTNISIEDDGSVTIAGENRDGAEDARNRIEAMTEEITVGRVYKGKVAAITDFGAFVEIAPGRDGLCHISELDHGFVSKVTDICKVGDEFNVQVIGIDDHDRVKLSRKVLLDKDKE